MKELALCRINHPRHHGALAPIAPQSGRIGRVGTALGLFGGGACEAGERARMARRLRGLRPGSAYNWAAAPRSNLAKVNASKSIQILENTQVFS
jgi:hypothetical protein